MLGRRLLLLGILLSCGVALVWLFGVRENESLFSGRRVSATARNDSAESPSTTESTAKKSAPIQDAPSNAMAYTNAKIPVRESMPGRPDVKVLKYVINLGSSDGSIGRRLHARDVEIDIYNKKLEPDSKLLAIVKGNTAELEFRDPPDPKTGFKDNQPTSMSLAGKNKVTYLNEAGETIATLENENLHLSDAEVSGPGPNTITMQGLTITGTDLTYDRSTGEMVLQRDIKMVGKRFAVPSRRVDPNKATAPKKDDSNVPEKVIVCDGPFSFKPTKSADKSDKKAAGSGDDLSALIAGGLMTFHGNVIATQGDASKLESEDLEITLDQSSKKPSQKTGTPDTEPTTATATAESGNLTVKRTFAKGTPNKPATMHDPRGNFVAETLLDEAKEDGSWVTLTGEPRVNGAKLGSEDGASGSGSDAPSFDAAASHQIRMRPKALAADAPAGSPKLMTIELDGEATLHRGASASDAELTLHADQIEMLVTQASGATKSSLANLVAHGNANGNMERGTFKGDRITLRPREGSNDPNAMQLEIEPNPYVDLSLGAEEDGGPERRAKFNTLANGKLLWMPEAGDQTPARASFTGPTHVDMYEGEEVATTLDAMESMVIEFVSTADKQSISQLVAKGDVKFDSKTQKTTGSGSQMTLVPEQSGPGKISLVGAPAVATKIDDDGSKQTIRAATIDYDPQTGSIDARISVDVDMGALTLGPSDDPSAEPKTPSPTPSGGSKLYCDHLSIHPKSETEKTTIIEAFGSVVIDDPVNGAHATASRFSYDESQGFAHLFGEGTADATATRQLGSDSKNKVSITGPELILDHASSRLVCERNGRIEIIQPLADSTRVSQADATDANGNATSTVKARCSGPIRYSEDKLELNNDVVVHFEEKGEEVRSVWSDHMTVYLDPNPPQAAPPSPATLTPAGAAASKAATSTSGTSKFKEILAEGRVHMTQAKPRLLTAEGQTLRWKNVNGVETMFLYGSSPKCWVKGLSVNEHVRYEADSFVLQTGSQAFTAENGRMLYDPEVLQR